MFSISFYVIVIFFSPKYHFFGCYQLGKKLFQQTLKVNGTNFIWKLIAWNLMLDLTIFFIFCTCKFF